MWVGNNNGDEMRYGVGGSRVAAPIWNTFLRNVYNQKQATEDDKENEFTLPRANSEFFPRVRIPRTSKNILNGEVDDLFPHSLLYFIDKNNPTGGVPRNPEADPLFEHFERPVRNWAGVEYNEDKVIDSTGIIGFVSPEEENQVIYEPDLLLGFTISAPKEIKEVKIYLDDELLDTHEVNGSNIAISDVVLQNIKLGVHTITIKVIAKDSSSYIATRSFSYIEKREAPPLIIIDTELDGDEDVEEEIEVVETIENENERESENSRGENDFIIIR